MLPILFKLDSKDKLRSWSIEMHQENDSDGFFGVYTIEYGLEGGKRVTTKTDVLVGKNIGKTNETTPYEQAIIEAKSLWNKQINRKGYTEAIPDLNAKKLFSPMLAKSYNKPGTDLNDLKDGKHIKFPCMYQNKLDGIRCIANRGMLKSRRHKEFTTMGHIQEIINSWNIPDNIHLDGELYIHGVEFQEITSLVKKFRDPKAENGHVPLGSLDIEYHVYDIYNEDVPNASLGERDVLRNALIRRKNPSIIVHVDSWPINNSADVETKLDKALVEMYEGIMLRNTYSSYKVDGRSADLQKVKRFVDQEFAIVGAYENVGTQAGQCTFTCVTDSGREFGVKPEGNAQQREQYWQDWNNGDIPVGSMLTTRFFCWTDGADPVPRFPIGVNIRDYE